MSLMTGEQYIESIRAMHMNVYMFGKKSGVSRGRPHPAPLPQLGAHDL